jgi:hypothetical protein
MDTEYSKERSKRGAEKSLCKYVMQKIYEYIKE